MPTRSSGLPQSHHENPAASGSGAPSRPGKKRKNPLYFSIDMEVAVASRVVWIASSARAHQGPATIHATARMARERIERTDRISKLRMRSSLAMRSHCVAGSGCYAAASQPNAGSISSVTRLNWRFWSYPVTRSRIVVAPASKYLCRLSMHCMGEPAATQSRSMSWR